MSTIVLALPSKGRLQEQTLDYLSDAGMPLNQSRGVRDYAATLEGVPGFTVALMSAGEISTELLAGRIHLGVTGEDLLAENGGNGSGRTLVLERLGFGRANVIVAVPRAWIDVATMADLDDVAASFHARHNRKLRVATKYINLARDFFASHGIADYRIVESLGATEGAPAAGAAEAIVDIATTGSTLAANGLKVLDDGVILKSQASLVASLNANWTSSMRQVAGEFLNRIAARALAKSSQIIRVDRKAELNAAIQEVVSSFAATDLAARDAASHALLVPEIHAAAAIALLRQRAPTATLTAEKPNQVFLQKNLLAEKLFAALP